MKNIVSSESIFLKQLPVKLREPRVSDGPALHALVAACPPLDPNSRYCNLLHCTHFAATSVAAEREGALVGFVSAYLLPGKPERPTLFVWQVAVHEQARGLGLGRCMLQHLLRRPACAHVRYLETTVTRDNTASEALFEGLARVLGTGVRRHRWFDGERHLAGRQATEYLWRIGPLNRSDTHTV